MLRGKHAIYVALALSACAPTQYDDDPDFTHQLDGVKADVARRAEQAPARVPVGPEAGTPGEMPAWYRESGRPLLAQGERPMTLDDLFIVALKYSYQMHVFADVPLIRETGKVEAEGAFDPRFFVQPQFDHVNEPVGSTLVSRARDRFVEDETSVEVGLRKKFGSGAEFTVSERLADTDSNADFFVPGRQTGSTFTIRFVQPLLAGGGITYNESVLYLADLDSRIAEEEFSRQAESHLLEIARSYWGLYAARAVYALAVQQAGTVREIRDELKARANADALQHQILRAESALKDREADLVRTAMAILNAQERLYALVNEEGGWAGVEIIPSSPILDRPFKLPDGRSPGTVAVEHRPEIVQAQLQLRAAAVRLGMNENEVMPTLNLILEGRMGGLGANRAFGDAFRDQGHVDEAGGLVGLLFEIPLGNDAAEARLTRRRLEMRQQFNQLRTAVDTVLLEVRISEREVDVGYRDFVAKSEAARAAREEVEFLVARKDIAAMREPTSPYILDLMGAQDRQMDAERALAQSVATYQVAVLNLQRAQGTLLESSSIAPVRSEADELPVLKLEKGPSR